MLFKGIRKDNQREIKGDLIHKAFTNGNKIADVAIKEATYPPVEVYEKGIEIRLRL